MGSTLSECRPQTLSSHEEKRSGEPSRISWASAHFCDCHLAMFKAKPAQKSMDARKIFTVAREVLHNNYRSCNLIGPYHFWGISLRNLTLFIRPFLTGRCAQAEHETKVFRLIRNEHSMNATTMPSNRQYSGGLNIG